MPYHNEEDLPENVKKMPDKQRRQWMHVFNTTYKDCEAEGGKDCETKAFRVANGVLKKKKMSDGTTYTELSLGSLLMGRAFDGLAPGFFRSKSGMPVEVTPDDLPSYLENTRRKLEAERGENGDIVGIPIFSDDHTSANAAGWIKGLDIESNSNGAVLRFKPRWTELGADLIRKGLQKFFSAEIDPEKKVIVGGSLTNRPASKNDQQHILLRPIELSESMFSMEIAEDEQTLLERMGEKLSGLVFFGKRPDESNNRQEEENEGDDDMKVDELTAEQKQEIGEAWLSDLFGKGEVRVAERLQTLIDGKVEEGVAVKLAAREAEVEIAQFSDRITGGDEKHPQGFKLDKERIKKALASLSAEQRKEWMEILGSIQENGLVEFSENGHGRQLQGKTALPEAIAVRLKSGDLTVERLKEPLFNYLGDLSEYDLSEFEKKE